jgi:hypothetical protein
VILLATVDRVAATEVDAAKLLWTVSVVAAVSVTTIVSVRKVEVVDTVEVSVRVLVSVEVTSVVDTLVGTGTTNAVPEGNVSAQHCGGIVVIELTGRVDGGRSVRWRSSAIAPNCSAIDNTVPT